MKNLAPLILLASFPLNPHPTLKQTGVADPITTSLAHVTNTFNFTLKAPLTRAAPLFGPAGERCWAGQHWNPEFLYPNPGMDVPGAVFTVQHGSHKSVWINTIFDLGAGRMQYVALIPETLIFSVDVRLTPIDSSTTSVAVTYSRTALVTTANGQVEAMGKDDRSSGPDWQRDIESCLKETPNRKD
jgi:hypothetical protein